MTECCGPALLGGAPATSPEALMRSRYVAYTQRLEDYLLATWHPSTRPKALELASDPQPQWLGLTVKRQQQSAPNHGLVEFVARYKINGRAHRLHETSRFVRENERWFYVDGDFEG
jgi:SEC-C motif-containing protein